MALQDGLYAIPGGPAWVPVGFAMFGAGRLNYRNFCAGDAAAPDLEGSAGSLGAGSADAYVVTARAEGPEESGVQDAIGQIAGSYRDVGAVPRPPVSPDLDLGAAERGRGGHDGRPGVPAYVEHHRSGLAGLGDLFHR
jgi:hypothetical protein